MKKIAISTKVINSMIPKLVNRHLNAIDNYKTLFKDYPNIKFTHPQHMNKLKKVMRTKNQMTHFPNMGFAREVQKYDSEFGKILEKMEHIKRTEGYSKDMLQELKRKKNYKQMKKTAANTSKIIRQIKSHLKNADKYSKVPENTLAQMEVLIRTNKAKDLQKKLEAIKKYKLQKTAERKRKKKNQLDYAIGNAVAGAVAGAVGASLVQPLDTISNIKQKTGQPTSKIWKTLKSEAFREGAKTFKTTQKELTGGQKALSIMKRMNQGLGWKLLKIAPSTAASFAAYEYLKRKLN